MSDPRRYLDDADAPEGARALLRSAGEDGLDPARAAAVARALGLGTANAAPPSPPKAGGVGKWVLGGAAILAASALVVFTTRSTSEATPAVVTPPAVVSEPAPAFPVPTADAISVAELPEAPPPPPTATLHAAAPIDDLPAQLHALEDVRRALAEHRTADARAGLVGYDRTFARKRLADEARVLDIETLFAEGKTSDAQAKGRAFLVAAPDSPYAARVRSLVGSAP